MLHHLTSLRPSLLLLTLLLTLTISTFASPHPQSGNTTPQLRTSYPQSPHHLESAFERRGGRGGSAPPEEPKEDPDDEPGGSPQQQQQNQAASLRSVGVGSGIWVAAIVVGVMM